MSHASGSRRTRILQTGIMLVIVDICTQVSFHKTPYPPVHDILLGVPLVPTFSIVRVYLQFLYVAKGIFLSQNMPALLASSLVIPNGIEDTPAERRG
jgi:hypothetical protein